MDRDGKVLPPAELERLEVGLRGVAGLLAGDVEADDASFAIRHGKLRHFERVRPVAHGADQLTQRDAVVAFGALEPERNALDDLLEVQAALGVEYRRIPDFGVHDPVAREILAAFVRDTLEGLLGLHDRDRVGEPPQVEGKRA